MMRSKAPWLVIVGALVACASSEQSQPARQDDEVEVIPFSSTRVLGAADLALLEPDAQDGRLVFRSPPAALGEIAVGDVLVAGVSPASPAGLLRVVTGVRERGPDGLVLDTLNAPLQAAFRKVHVRAARATSNLGEAAWTLQSGGAGQSLIPQTFATGGESATQSVDIVIFDGDGNAATTDDQVVVHGKLGGGFDYRLGLDVDWGEVNDLPGAVKGCLLALATGVGAVSCALANLMPEAKVSFEVEPQFRAEVRVTGSAVLKYEKEIHIATLHQPPLILGPLVFTPSIDVFGKIEGAASGGFSTGVGGGAKFKTSVDISSKHQGEPEFHPPTLSDVDFGGLDTEVTLHARARAGIGARLNVLLYAVTGPYASADVYAEIAADPFADPCWKLHVGLEGTLGLVVTSPKLPVLGHVTLADWHAPQLKPLDLVLASGSCKIGKSDAPALPPGSGPDARALVMPAFSPWAKTYAGANDGSVAVSAGADNLAFTEVRRSIDDRTVVASSGSRALVKLDGAGKVVWARAYKSADGADALPVLRVTDALDAGLWVLTREASGAVGVLSLDQAGGPRQHFALEASTNPCMPEPVALARRARGDVAVLARCNDQSSAEVFTIDANGQNARAWRIADAGGNRLEPTLITAVDDELFIAGTARLPEGDRMFALRLDANDQLVFASLYDGCAEAPDLSPNSAAIGEQGALTVVGSGGSHRNAFVAQIDRGGTVGFSRFPGLGFGLSKIFVLTSIARLPTSGFVVAGTTADLLAESPRQNTPALVVAGFDVAGRPLWARDYSLASGTPNTFRPTAHPGLRLTDDGGALVVGMAAGDASSEGSLWAMKVFAKDGTANLNPLLGASQAFVPKDLTCGLAARAWAPVISAMPASGAPQGLVVDSLNVETASQN